MAKKIEKEPKPLKSAPKEPKAKAEVTTKCGACNGSGLERPAFTNSPLCSVCNGVGIIN